MRRSVGLVLLAALAGPGCGPAPPTETALEPVHQLQDGGPMRFPPMCDVDDELRPAFGCLSSTQLAVEKDLRAGETFRQHYPLPPELGHGILIVEPAVRFAARESWRPLSPSVARDPGGTLEVTVPLPAQASSWGTLDLAIGVTRVPAAEDRITSRALRIGHGAVFSVGLGVASLARAAGAAPVEFHLAAERGSATEELLREVVDPADRATAGWRDRRIDLDRLAGETVRFVFTTRVVPRPGQTEAAFSAPLWGAPQILEPRPRRRRPNLLLISLDTLRADHVGAYGADLPTTPALDAFAAEGTLFERTLATYPSTAGSHMTIWTGLYPSVHGVIGPFDILSPDVPTLPELLAAHGYQTGAVTEDGMLVAGSGFHRGFSFYRENKGTTIWDATGQVDVTFPAGLRWLEAHRDEKFFLFLHTYQVHEPYSPPPAFNLFTTYHEDDGEMPITAATPVAIRDRHLYAGEARYTDSELAKVLDGLRTLGLAEKTLVVVISDHGEEFWEHGWKGHDETLYEEVLRVPLILRAPGLVPAGLRVPTAVSLIDLMPTLLELLTVPAPRGLQGRSLVPLLANPTTPAFAERVLYAELTKRAKKVHMVTARSDGFKWIWREGTTPPLQVYDLRSDPGEHRDLAAPELAARGEPLRDRYRALVATAVPRSADAPPPTVDARTEDKLRALGYVR